ncbi:MAG: hypothetical protein LUF78_13280 [Clostridiales bacterium]|nr:hypothetical protein [Clostridiales bacterium]
MIFMLPITMFYAEKAIEVGGYTLEGFPNRKIRYQDLSEDLDLWSRMSDLYVSGYYMLTIPKVLYYYRKTQSSLSTGREKQLVMNYKMAYVKHNLKRRRQGLKDNRYIEFEEGLSEKEHRKIKKNSDAGYYYRQGAFDLIQHRFAKGGALLLRSFVTEPKYVLQKVSAGFIR